MQLSFLDVLSIANTKLRLISSAGRPRIQPSSLKGHPMRTRNKQSLAGSLAGKQRDQGEDQAELHDILPPHAEMKSQSRVRQPRKLRVVACEPCRARRIRCDGRKPICRTCEARGSECEYPEVGVLEYKPGTWQVLILDPRETSARQLSMLAGVGEDRAL